MKRRYMVYLLPMTILLMYGMAFGQNQSPLIVNEILADPDGTVELGDSNGDGIRSSTEDEFVELANATSDTLDLTGWMVGDDESINFRFPDGYLLPPRTIIVIFGGGDISNAPGYDADLLKTRAFSADSTVGNGLANGGDFVVLLSPDSTMNAYVSYGGLANTGDPPGDGAAGLTFAFAGSAAEAGNMNTSLTRFPDGNTVDADPFILHNTVVEAPYSPGTTVDGLPAFPKPTPPVFLIINEVLADPATSVELGDANMDGTRSSSEDEFVELANAGPDTVDLTGWQLGDDEDINFTFPDGYKLAPRELLVVFGGGDVSNVPGYDPDTLKTKVFSAGGMVGNGLANGGEVILLLSPDGTYDMYLAYGTKSGTGGPAPGTYPEGTEFEFEIDISVLAGADNAVTRFPDGNILVTDPFVQHLSVSDKPFSPAQTIDGKFLLPKPTPPITVVVNEIFADLGTSLENGDANRDGVIDALQDQFVEITNPSDEAVDLSGWQLGDGSGFTFTFPSGYSIASQAIVAVFGGGDVSSAPGYSADPMMTRVFVANGSIGDGLDASGDHVTLVSADGTYDTYLAYGSASGMGAPGGDAFTGIEWEFEVDVAAVANQDNSITRSPDGEFIEADPFVQHLTVSENAFSPAQTIAGLPSLDAFVDVPHPWGTGYALAYNYMERDRVEVRDAAQLVPIAMDSGTVEMWFRPDSVIADATHPPDFTYLFSKNLSGNQVGDLGIAWPRGQGRLQFFLQDGVGPTEDVWSHPEEFGNMFFPRWYHLACTWKLGDSLRMFIDGKLIDTSPSTFPVLGGEQIFAIGNGSVDLFDARFEGFRGMIDEVRFSLNVRYTQSFDLPTQPYTPDQFTLALWHMDEGQGAIAEDVTGNGFTGYLGGTGEDSVASRPQWVDLATMTDINERAGEVPEQFTLSNNYPNPFNPSTQIDFTVPRAANVEITVFNILGQKVKVLIDRKMKPGTYTTNFNAREISTGMYFYVLKVDGQRMFTRKMMLIK